MIFEYRRMFGGIKLDVVLNLDKILSKYECKIWSRACSIDSWQNKFCTFINRMSILILVRLLENSSQGAYSWSCDGNTAMPLPDVLEIGRFTGSYVSYSNAGLGNWVAWVRHYYVTTPSWISTSHTEESGDRIAQTVERLP